MHKSVYMIIISAHWTVSALSSSGDSLGTITAVLWVINGRMSAFRGVLHKGILRSSLFSLQKNAGVPGRGD